MPELPTEERGVTPKQRRFFRAVVLIFAAVEFLAIVVAIGQASRH